MTAPICPVCQSPDVRATGMMALGGEEARSVEEALRIEERGQVAGQVPMLCKDCGHAWPATVPYSAPAGDGWE